MFNPNTSPLWTTGIQDRYNTSQIKPLFRELRMKGDFLNNLRAFNGIINLIKKFRISKYADLVSDGYAMSGMMRDDFTYFFHSGASMGKFLGKTSSTGQRVLAEFERKGIISKVSGPHRRSEDPNRRMTLWRFNKEILEPKEPMKLNLHLAENDDMGLMGEEFIKPTKGADMDSLNPRIYNVTHPYRITHSSKTNHFYEVISFTTPTNIPATTISVSSTAVIGERSLRSLTDASLPLGDICEFREENALRDNNPFILKANLERDTPTQDETVEPLPLRIEAKNLEKRPERSAPNGCARAAAEFKGSLSNTLLPFGVSRGMIHADYPIDGTNHNKDFFEKKPDYVTGPRSGVGYLPLDFVEDMELLYQDDEWVYMALDQSYRTDIGADEVRNCLENFKEYLSIKKPRKLEYSGRSWPKIMGYFVKIFLNGHRKIHGTATFNGENFFKELAILAEHEDYRGWEGSKGMMTRMLSIEEQYQVEMVRRAQDLHDLVQKYYLPCTASKSQAGLTTIDYAYLIARWGTKGNTLKMLKSLPLFMSGEKFYHTKGDMLSAIENAYKYQVTKKGLN